MRNEIYSDIISQFVVNLSKKYKKNLLKAKTIKFINFEYFYYVVLEKKT